MIKLKNKEESEVWLSLVGHCASGLLSRENSESVQSIKSAKEIAIEVADELFEEWQKRLSNPDLNNMRTCIYCEKLTRNTTAGCDHCDVENK